MIPNTILAIVVSTASLLGAHANAQNASDTATETTRTWSDHAAHQLQLNALVKSHRGDVTIETIGTSLQDRKLYAIRIARPGAVDPDARPAILLVAGIDPSRPHTSECAVDVASTLLQRAGQGDELAIAFLESNTLYVIPRVNPDGHEWNLTQAVHTAHDRNMRADDADRDRATDEDGPEDLNNDGIITMMRVHDPLKGKHVADSDDPRLHATPDRTEGERPQFYLLTEGIDNDGDGRHNEDAFGGVDLDMNFMHGYQAHADGAGRHQLSEPESMALMQYALNHQNIAAVIVYGRHDNLSSPPSANGRDDAGAPKTIESGDEELYERVSDRFIELTKLEHVDSSDWSGSFAGWAYGQYGVPSFATPLWTMPKLEEDEEDDESVDSEDDESADRPRGGPPAEGERARGDGSSGRRGGFDQQAMLEEFDTNKNGEIDEDEREALRESMRERFGGRGGPGGARGGAGGGRGGPGGRGGRSGEASEDTGSTRSSRPSGGGGQQLTPSAFGDISQETIDELMEKARDQGMEVDEEQMSQVTPEMIEMFAQRAGVEVRRVSKTDGDANGGGGKRRGGGKATDADWLQYSDEQRDGGGFVEWTRVEHPDYDHVEVGGWVPGFRTVPPIEALDAITTVQADFILDLAGRLPDVQLQHVETERLSDGLWMVRASLVNEGRLPAGTAMAKRNRRARPWVVRISTEPNQVISGSRVQKVWSIGPDGGRHDMRWIIEHPDGSPLAIELFSDKYGQTTHMVPMTDNDTDGGDA